MRMWMVDPRIMCRKHLLGEWRELYAIRGLLRNQVDLSGYTKNNLIHPLLLNYRHEQLKEEMLRREYNPQAPWDINETSRLLSYLPIEVLCAQVDIASSLNDLLSRCEECSKLNETITGWRRRSTAL